MTPTLNQSKCLRMLEEWQKGSPHLWQLSSSNSDSACLSISEPLSLEDMTALVLLCHRDGLSCRLSQSMDEFPYVEVFPVKSDPPSLTKLRRRAHAGRVLLGSYAKERKEGV